MLPLTLTYYIAHRHGRGNPGLLDRQIFVLVAYPTCKMFWNRRVFFRRIKLLSLHWLPSRVKNFGGAAFLSRVVLITDIRLASSTACLRPARPSLHRLSTLTQTLNSGMHTWPPYEKDLTSGIGSPITALVQPTHSQCLS